MATDTLPGFLVVGIVLLDLEIGQMFFAFDLADGGLAPGNLAVAPHTQGMGLGQHLAGDGHLWARIHLAEGMIPGRAVAGLALHVLVSTLCPIVPQLPVLLLAVAGFAVLRPEVGDGFGVSTR